jgi:hypothetical protein
MLSKRLAIGRFAMRCFTLNLVYFSVVVVYESTILSAPIQTITARPRSKNEDFFDSKGSNASQGGSDIFSEEEGTLTLVSTGTGPLVQIQFSGDMLNRILYLLIKARGLVR